MRRLEGWEHRLADFVDEARSRPFLWGDSDCCLMPCDGVLAITGVDPAAKLRGRYKTLRGAQGALRRFARGGVVETVEKIAADLAAPEVTLRFARRGDICLITDPELVETGFDAMLAICLGREVGIAQVDGLRLLPLARAARAWGVG